jgi:hypothetical protein
MYEFLKHERNIVSYYDHKEDIKEMTAKEFINKVTLYIGLLLDEIVEADEALDDPEITTIDEYLEEVIDVAMYLGSIVSLMILKCDSLNDDDFLEKDDFCYNDYCNEYIDNTNYMNTISLLNLSLKDITFSVIKSLVEVRTSFPQRKWHKPYREFTKEEFQEVLCNGIETLTYSISLIVDYLMSITSNNYDKLNELMNKKFKKIINIIVADYNEKYDKAHNTFIKFL